MAEQEFHLDHPVVVVLIAAAVFFHFRNKKKKKNQPKNLVEMLHEGEEE